VAIQGAFCGKQGCAPVEIRVGGHLITYFSIEFLSLVLRQLHFPEPTRRGLFDYAKFRQAHILELGCVVPQ
jgi:hypothetical protein